jgi:hypothetical protein
MAIDVVAPYDAPKEEEIADCVANPSNSLWDEKNTDITNFFLGE